MAEQARAVRKMGISQHEAVSLLNHTIFRPGWMVSARPVPGDSSRVLIGIEVKTVDSSFVTRGGEYKVPLTERALIRADAWDYAEPEALLLRVLAFIGELHAHEDREFLRTWDPEAERWVALLHSHVPESARAWDRLQAQPLPAIERISVSEDGPWLAEDAGCEYVCWAEDDNKKRGARQVVSAGCDMEEDKGDCWESSNAGRTTARAVAGCEDGINDEDCWENGKRALANAAPCNEQDDGNDDDGPQRVALAHAAAHPVVVAGCNECAGWCAGQDGR